jgi:NADH:ubiquinone oxidoreductase subunit 4 (subunit M)
VVSLVGIIFIGVYPQPLIEIVQKLVGPFATVGSAGLK